ncbi:MAG: DcaP family trimeric outer membrane transporter, partial [Thermoanaerobaculia bacterium]
ARILSLSMLVVALLLPARQLLAQDSELTVKDLQKQLNDQQKLLENQSQELDSQKQQLADQGKLLQSFQTRLDQLAQQPGAAAAAPPATKEQLALQERISKLEKELQNPPDAPADVLRAGDFPGSIRIPGSNMSGKVGGFVRLGFVDSLDPIISDDRFIVGTIPVEEGDEGKQGTTISAKRSRINLDMRMDSSVGQFRAFVEGDFAGDGGTENYRLRHAYGQYKHFLVGQTWTTLEDVDAQPEDVDFEGLSSTIQLRQPQVRWVKLMKNEKMLRVSLEDPQTSVPDAESASIFPDTIATIRRKRKWGHTQFGVLIRQLAVIPVGQESSDKATTFGWGFSFSGNLTTKKFDKRDHLNFQVNFGKGIGRYINDLGTIGGQDAAIDPETGDLEALPAYSGFLAYQHWWLSPDSRWLRNLRSTFVLSLVRVNNYDFQPDSAYKRTVRNSYNLIWSPINEIDLGIEFIWGERLNKSENKGTAAQLQFVSTFRF